MITVRTYGALSKTQSRITKISLSGKKIESILRSAGEKLIDALASATPVDTSLTANSWTYDVYSKDGLYSLVIRNTNVQDGIPVPILIQYGHASRGGAYIQGQDFINPAIRPIFDQVLAQVNREVTRR